jgi:hypothetical protein
MAKVTKDMKKAPGVEILGSGGSSDKVIIANQHTAPIIFPKKASGGVAVNPLVLPAGTTTVIDRAEWEVHRDNPVIRHYMDKRLLVEVTNEGPVPVLDNTSTDLEGVIPENLRGDERPGKEGISSGTTVKETKVVGEVAV